MDGWKDGSMTILGLVDLCESLKTTHIIRWQQILWQMQLISHTDKSVG